MKKFSALLLAIVLLISIPFTVSAEPEDFPPDMPPEDFPPDMPPEPGDAGFCGDDITYRIEYNVLYIEGTGDMYDYDMNMDVPWALSSGEIQSVSLSDGITSIGKNCFANLMLVDSISLPSTVTKIGDYAFDSCTGMRYLYGLENVEYIGEGAFCYSGIESAELPKIVEIGNNAFAYSNIYEVYFSDESELFSIGDEAFYGCENLLCFTVPESVQIIGEAVFGYCTSLEALEVERGNFDYVSYSNCIITRNSNILIAGCKTSIIPKSVEKIGNRAFEGCVSLDGISIPDGVTEIGTEAFFSCRSLTSLIIPSSVTVIGENAFNDCANLTSLVIPTTLTEIGNGAFKYCDNLETVNLIGDSSEYEKIIIGKDNACFEQAAKIYSYAPHTVASGECGENVEYTLTDEGTLTISGTGDMYDYEDEESPFYEDERIKTVVIGNGVTSIGDWAFKYCTNLTSIEIPASVTSIGSGAFYDCSSLASITIPEGVTFIGDEAFYYCASLASITLPDGVTSIGDYTFYNCTNLASITIPESVISIGERAFQNCTNLASITLPEGVTSIENGAFQNCTNLAAITIPKGVTSIVYTFCGCSSLTSITIPEGVTFIGERTFCRCTSLASITIPSSVTSIDYCAFYCCDNLETVNYTGSEEQFSAINIGEYNDELLSANIVYNYGQSDAVASGECGENVEYTLTADGVLTISGTGDMYDYGWGESPFYEDERINTVIIGSGVTSIGNVTFTYCNNLTSITIPEGVTSIGDYAFACCENLSSITIPESMESLGEEAFSNCYKLTSIEIPNGITSFSRYVFYCCDNLEYNEYENGLYLGNEDNPYLVLADVISDECQTFEINENTKIVAGCAFNECFSLTSVTVPISVTYIGGDAFYNCPKLEVLNYIGSKAQFEAITIGDGKIVFLPENIVYNYVQINIINSGECGENVEYTLTADGLLTISGTGDMYDYSETTAPWIKKPAAKLMLKAAPLPKVKKAIIEEGVTSIGGGAFAGCDELAEIDIPTTVVSVGKNAFDGCDNLETVNYSASAYDFAKIEFADSGDVNILPKPKTAISCGDANGDGEINGSDLTILAQYIAKWSVSVSGGADANGDGEINGSDLTLLAQYIAKWSVILG